MYSAWQIRVSPTGGGVPAHSGLVSTIRPGRGSKVYQYSVVPGSNFIWCSSMVLVRRYPGLPDPSPDMRLLPANGGSSGRCRLTFSQM